MEELARIIARATTPDAPFRERQEAFGEIVRRFQDFAFGCAYSALGDFQLAEDAAQEAFLSAWRKLSDLREPAAFPGWLRQIVLSQCRTIRRGIPPAVTPLESAGEVPDAGPDPHALAAESEAAGSVLAAVRSLPEGERLVTTLFYLGEYPQAEIAAFLDLPVDTIKNRLRSARKRLRERMVPMAQEELRERRPSQDDRFVRNVLKLLAPDEGQHGESLYRLLEVAAPAGSGDWRHGRVAESHFDWRTSRIGSLDGEVVSVLGVFDQAMRIGTARVRTAGVNLDYTRPDQQDPALLEKTAQAALAAMREEGYELSVAFGSEELFRKLGYVAGWRELMWFIRTADLPVDPPEGSLEEFGPERQEELAALYNAEHETITGTVVRPTYRRNKHPGTFQGYLWKDAGGAAAGYVSVDSHPGPWRYGHQNLLWHDDSAGDPEQRLRVLGKLARQGGCEEVAFDRLPYRSPLGTRLRQMRCRIEAGYRTYVVRIVHLASLFEKLAPELSRRLGRSHLAGWEGELLIAMGEEQVMLSIERATVRVRTPRETDHAILGGQELAQLVVGAEAPEEIVEIGGIRLQGAAGELLPVLFPKQDPQMPNQDL